MSSRRAVLTRPTVTTSLKIVRKLRPTISGSAPRSFGMCATPWLKIQTTTIRSSCSYFNLGNRRTSCNLKTLINAVENEILLDGHSSFKSRYLQVEAIIVRVRCNFEKNEHLNWEEVEAEGKRLFEEQDNLLDEFVVAPEMQQGECDDEAEGINKDPALEEHVSQQDFGVQLNIKTANNSMVKVVNLFRALVDDPTYFGLVRKLNVEQRLFSRNVPCPSGPKGPTEVFPNWWCRHGEKCPHLCSISIVDPLVQ
jgi:hypothetical protein